VKDTGQRRRRGLPPAANVPVAAPQAESTADAEPAALPESATAPEGEAPSEAEEEAEPPPASKQVCQANGNAEVMESPFRKCLRWTFSIEPILSTKDSEYLL
jgi:hypothetical protein